MSTTKAPSQPLYPAYLPTRPDGYAATIDVPPFEGDEPGVRADPAKPHLLRPNVEATNITPRIGTELRGIQLSELSEEGLEYANSIILPAGKKEQECLDKPPSMCSSLPIIHKPLRVLRIDFSSNNTDHGFAARSLC